MYLFTNFILFVLIWWIMFFISLPIKISVPEDQEDGHASSAPKKTYIGLKVVITTVISMITMLILIYFNFNLSVLFKQ